MNSAKYILARVLILMSVLTLAVYQPVWADGHERCNDDEHEGGHIVLGANEEHGGDDGHGNDGHGDDDGGGHHGSSGCVTTTYRDEDGCSHERVQCGTPGH